MNKESVIQGLTVACMATYPARFKSLPMIVESIIGQVDVLCVYVNQSNIVPTSLNHDKIQVFLASNFAGDLSANGKVFPLQFIKDSYVFLIDDDFIFPEDYVARLKETIDRFHGRVCVGVHGSVFAPDARWYFERAVMYSWQMELSEHKLVQMLGSGCLAFHQAGLRANFEDFLPQVMVDLTFAIKTRQQAVPMLAVKRPSQWIRYVGYTGLYQEFVRGLTWHTQAMREHRPWSAQAYLDLVRRFFVSEFGDWDPDLACRLDFDREVVRALSSRTPWLRSWGRTMLALRARNDFLELVSRQAGAAG